MPLPPRRALRPTHCWCPRPASCWCRTIELGDTTSGDDNGLGTGRGETAFRSTRGLIYNEDRHTAIMSGDVFVKHVSDNVKELPVQLT